MCLIICVYARLWGSWQNLQGRVINQLYSSACNTFHCKKPQMPLPSGNLSVCHTEGFSPTESPARQTLKTAGFHILWAPLPQGAGALHFTCDSLGEQGPFSPPPPLSTSLGLLARRPVSGKCWSTFNACSSVLRLSSTVSLGSRALGDPPSLQ